MQISELVSPDSPSSRTCAILFTATFTSSRLFFFHKRLDVQSNSVNLIYFLEQKFFLSLQKSDFFFATLKNRTPQTACGRQNRRQKRFSALFPCLSLQSCFVSQKMEIKTILSAISISQWRQETFRSNTCCCGN